MKVLGISGSIVGSKTRIAVENILNRINEQYEDIEIELIDLKQYNLVFSDGRDYRDYTGDTKLVLEKIMEADGYIIGTPTFQASIPGTLKNLFDLLPMDAFREKVVGLVSTAGSAKHYLVAEQQLKPILNYMQAMVIPKYVFIEEKHYHKQAIIDDEIVFRLNRLADDVVFFLRTAVQMKASEESAYPF
ncbi:NADPH-dependent FMN reductase [Oceanobacillus profundus]|uniref:NAD(P)H-dependent oxidoreductase n=1 Tax=Oceanobacillus profundus TaxID=372463 RepID=A0A417YN86_9BACI|nr:NADPH-dependent FMN reductase [Oceanobacillus profundus]MDO6447680.1 NADPH-dependent FMN reductase [Oceanobacillus profundus]PAE29014.1 FMN reductase [Paenibacillus sp. 7884-2]RHW35235.1 NAD(P)H-dependent oxidoreductase [Oceanobacillus profundus]